MTAALGWRFLSNWLGTNSQRRSEPAGGVQMGKYSVLGVLSCIFLLAGLVTLVISFVLSSVGRTGADIFLGIFSIGLGVFSFLLMSVGAIILFFLEGWDRPELR
jgi:hypothetical protein